MKWKENNIIKHYFGAKHPHLLFKNKLMDCNGDVLKNVKSPSNKSLHVLIVEDDEYNTIVISRILKLLGHSYESAVTGIEALELIKQQAFDVILMDLQMPQLDGFETTSTIRKDPAYSKQADIPIVALTAHAMDHHREKCQQVGMNNFIAKPVDIQGFKTMLETVKDNQKDTGDNPLP